MSILYSNNFNFSEGELKKFPEFADSTISRRNHGHAYEGGENYSYDRASGLEVDSVFGRFTSSINRANDSGSQSLGDFGEGFVKKEMTESEFCDGSSLYRNQEVRSLQDDNSVSANVGTAVDSSFRFVNSLGIDNSQLSARNFSNLVRQSSCPAEFSNMLAIENGFGRTTNLNRSGPYNGTPVNGSGQLSLSNDLSLSSRQMCEISEGNVVLDSSDGHDLRNYSNERHGTSFLNNSWDESAFRSLKRGRDNAGFAFSNSIPLENKAETESGSSVYGLTHHLSLPKKFSEMATNEKFLQFQDAVPFKIRAKRGCATHPRSIAERVRRTRISERMKKLQDLFPSMDKQTSIADMLDWAVDHIKDLQKQLQTLSDSTAKCTCSS